MNRKFINFTNDELDRLAEALKVYGDKNLLKQVNKEIRTRERHLKLFEEWKSTHAKAHVC